MRDRFVQVGRVCLLNYGKRTGLCVIVDIIDHNKVLIDGPKQATGIPRQVTSLKRLVLTPYVITIPHGIHHKYLLRKFKAARIVERFRKTAWGKKLAARRRKAKASDFDRFVAMKSHRASFFNPSKKRMEERKAKREERKKEHEKRAAEYKAKHPKVEQKKEVRKAKSPKAVKA